MGIYFLFWTASLAYGIFIFALYRGLRRLKRGQVSGDRPFVSVIVPARNEERTLPECLQSLADQTYPQDNYEVIIVDDHSEDRTLEQGNQFVRRHTNYQLISLVERVDHRSPKKMAIAAAVKLCRGEIILTTDADSVVPKQWIAGMVGCFRDDVGVVTSWLQVRTNSSLLSKLESLDALSLVLITAGAIGLGKPFLANGANFGYRKKVFEQVNGFADIDQYASGDDDLFLLKIRRQTAWKVVFASPPELSVSTHPKPNLKDFLSQRIRWASKGAIYPLPNIVLQGLLYLYLIALSLGLPLSLIYNLPIIPIVSSLAIKVCLDYFFMRLGCRLLRRRLTIHHFLLTEAFQMLYLIVVGMLGQFGRFKWKGRSYSRGKSSCFGSKDISSYGALATVEADQKTV
jgi:cellulose synthase/poly-beta-1,6-N-acetylglucosamine synthase-like glycosyltransferase